MRGPASEPLREPRAFLATVAHRVLFSHWRRRDLEHAYLEALTASSEDALAPSAEECAAVLQVLSRLDAVLCGLGPRVRQVFLLDQLEGIPFDLRDHRLLLGRAAQRVADGTLSLVGL